MAIFAYCNECNEINKRIKEHKNNISSVSSARYFDQVDIENELKEKQKEVSDSLKEKFLDYSKLGYTVKRIQRHIDSHISASIARYFNKMDMENELKVKQEEVKTVKGRIHIIINANLFGGKIV